MLYVFAGLPGTGKTTLARHLARSRGGLHLRIDTIEQALRDTGATLSGPEGYVVAYRLAADNLRLGSDVIADSVNPLHITRRAWREVAVDAGARAIEIEVICSDSGQHRTRVECRLMDIPGQPRLTWNDIQTRVYEPWESERIILDTAGKSLSETLAELDRVLAI